MLSEFDEGKRSCRRRLAGHNERRRKLQPDAQNPAALSSRSSSPMHTDAFHMHGTAVSLSLEGIQKCLLQFSSCPCSYYSVKQIVEKASNVSLLLLLLL